MFQWIRIEGQTVKRDKNNKMGSPCLHQCLRHDIHRKRNHPDKKGSDLNNSAERIENGGKLSR